MPKENIERALNGKNIDVNKLQAVTYEGFGPGSCAIIVDCLTDNKKRTVSEIRHILSKGMGNLGSVGCASRLFNFIGMITVSISSITHFMGSFPNRTIKTISMSWRLMQELTM